MNFLMAKPYIESKFYGDMTWDNWGTVWELDHIVALHLFDLTNRKQFLKAINYKNLQPLTKSDHLKKTLKERLKLIKVRKQLDKPLKDKDLYKIIGNVEKPSTGTRI